MTLHATALPELLVRPARPDDVPALHCLRQASLWCLASRDYAPTVIDSFIRRHGTLDAGLIAAGTYFVAELTGELVGCGGWSPEASLGAVDLAPDTALVRAVYVHPAWGRRGIGRRVMLHAERHAAAHGRRRAELLATLTGVPLYAHLGYREVGPVALEVAPGVTAPTIRMRKELAPARLAA